MKTPPEKKILHLQAEVVENPRTDRGILIRAADGVHRIWIREHELDAFQQPFEATEPDQEPAAEAEATEPAETEPGEVQDTENEAPEPDKEPAASKRKR